MDKIKLLLTAIVFLIAQNSGVMGAQNPVVISVPLDMVPKNTAILVIDIQPDFLVDGVGGKKGPLAVTGATKIYVKVLEHILHRVKDNKYVNIIATQDWHPKGHFSFASSHPGKKALDEIASNVAGQKQTL